RRGVTDVTRRDDALGGPVMGNIMIDHVSASWGLDENISMYRNIFHTGDERKKLPAVNITIQNTISAEGLSTYNHSLGSTLGGLNSTFMRNLWANNAGRNPSVGMWGEFTFANNVIFNWWNRSVDGGDYRSMFNMINNYYKPGPMTPKDEPIRYRIINPERGNIDALLSGGAYVTVHIIVGSGMVSADPSARDVRLEQMTSDRAKQYSPYIGVRDPIPIPYNIPIMSVQIHYNLLLESVGAIIPTRDAVDK